MKALSDTDEMSFPRLIRFFSCIESDVLETKSSHGTRKNIGSTVRSQVAMHILWRNPISFN